MSKADSRIWGELAKNPEGVKRNRDLEAACTSLREAIQKKQLKSSPEIILALEAVHCPVPKSVADHFTNNYAEEARSAGFKEIWLVGPIPSWTYKLA